MFGMMSLGIVVTLRDVLSGPAQRVVRSMKNIENASKFGGQLTRSGAQLTAFGALASGVADGMKSKALDLARPYWELEDALAGVRTITAKTFGSVDADIVQITNRAKAWEQQHTSSAAEYTRAHYLMQSAGLNTKAAIEGTDWALSLATATMGDATTASGLLASLYINMGDKTRPLSTEMEHLADVVTRTQQAFKLADLGQLNEGLKFGVPAAKMYKMELAETAATIGLLNTAGLEGGIAGTAFSGMMRNLNKASKDLRFEIARTSDGGVDLVNTLAGLQARFAGKLDLPKTQMAMQKAFGDEGLRAVTMLLGNVEGMRVAVNGVRNSTGATAAAQATLERTGSAAWQKMRNQLNAMKIDIAQSLNPAILSTTERIKSLAQWMGAFAKNHPGIMKLVAGLALVAFAVLAILAPVAIVGGTIVSAVGSSIKIYAVLARAIKWATFANWGFVASLLANPITWIVLGIVALIAGLVALVVYWDEVVAAMRRAGAWVVNVWNVVVAWVSGLVARMAGWVKENADYIAAALMVIAGPIGFIAGGAFLVIRHWSRIKEFFAGLVGGVVSALTGWVDAIRAFAGRLYDSGVGLFNAFIDGIKSRVTAVVDAVRGGLAKVRDLLPFSDAKAGPLSNLTESGAAFGATWAQGISRSMGSVAAAVEDVTAVAVDGLGPMNILAGPIDAADLAGRVQRSRASDHGQEAGAAQPSARQIVVNIRELKVMAKDVAEGDAFVNMLQGLALEVGGGT